VRLIINFDVATPERGGTDISKLLFTFQIFCHDYLSRILKMLPSQYPTFY
jgi:hypothetical protein